MKLDPRIIEGKKPLTCFDSNEAKRFICKECYFALYVSDFSDLSKTHKRVLTGFQSSEQPFVAKDKVANTDDEYVYSFCLPCEWVETSDVSETKGLKKEIENLRETVEALKSEINSLKGTIKTNSDRIHTIAQLQYGTPNPQANCSSEFVKQVLGVS